MTDAWCQGVLAAVRNKYPNFDVMPCDVQLAVVADYFDTPLGRLLRSSVALKQHTEAHETMLDALASDA